MTSTGMARGFTKYYIKPVLLLFLLLLLQVADGMWFYKNELDEGVYNTAKGCNPPPSP